MTPYPNVLPMESITFVVNAVRNKTVKTDLVNFAYHLWVVQGFVQSMAIGSPNGIATRAAAEPLPVDNLAPLECLSEMPTEVMYGAEDPEASLNIFEILTIATAVFQLLKNLGIFKKRKEDASTEDESPEIVEDSANPLG